MKDRNTEIGVRLREFAEKEFASLSDFAKALGILPQSLNQYLNGERKPGNKMEAKLRELGCDIIYLMYGKTKEQIDQEHASSIIRQADRLRPVYGTAPAGKGNITEEPLSYEEAPPDVQDEGKGYWLKVKGDSMYPKFSDGELIFINPLREPRHKDYAVISYNDHEDGCVKQLFFSGENVILKSVNPLYEPVTIPRKKISSMARVCYSKL